MASFTSNIDRRQFLGLATATGLYGLGTPAWAADGGAAEAQTLPESGLRVVVDNLRGPEGPTMLPDGRVVFIAQPGNVIAATSAGQAETLASGLGLIVGTALGAHGGSHLYICRMDPARMPRRGPGPDGPGTGGPVAGPAAPGAQPPLPLAGADSPGAAILQLDLKSKQVTPLYTECEGRPMAGPNKVAVDQWGDLWVTDVFDGAVYWARSDGSSIRRAVPSLPGAHGITLSPDLRKIYIGTDDRLVALTITARGQLAMAGDSPRVETITELKTWRADGIRTEANGNIVLACQGEGMVVLSPQGQVLSHMKLPGVGVSNFVFAGKDLRQVYATASALGQGGGVPGQSVGKVVTFAWPRPGLKPV